MSLGWRAAGGLVLVLGAAAAPAVPQDRARVPVWLADLEAFREDVQANCKLLTLKGVDWKAVCASAKPRVAAAKDDTACLLVMQDVVAALRDGHAYLQPVGVTLPAAPAEQFPGIVLAPAPRERVVVLEVLPALAGEAATLRPGMVVAKIDGAPAFATLEKRTDEAWARGGCSSRRRARYTAYRLALRGAPGTAVTLSVGTAGPRGTLTELREVRLTCDRGLARSRVPVAVPGLAGDGDLRSGRLADGTGYVQLGHMYSGRNRFDERFTAAMQAVRDAPALVVDLRGNAGGGMSDVFFEFFCGGQKAAGGKAWARPLAVLIDAGTFSAGEGAASMFRERTKARLLGETTAGSSSSKRDWKAPSGLFTVTYSWRGQTNYGNEITEFHGIAPHDEVEYDPETLTAGKDPYLERALAWLATQKR